jgi:hypothetical protein
VDDVVLCITSFSDVADLLNIALTCRRFGSAATAASDKESFMEQSACEWVEVASDYEKAWLPLPCKKDQWSSWMGIYKELLNLRAPPAFDRVIGRGIKHVSQTKSHVYISKQCQRQQFQEAPRMLRFRRPMKDGVAAINRTVSCAAIGNHIMRAGKHYVRFAMTRAEKISFGIIRPCLWIKTALTPCYQVIDFSLLSVRRCPGRKTGTLAMFIVACT